MGRKKLKKAVEYIAGYCNKHEKCGKCPLRSDDGCKLTEVYNPCDWDSIFKYDRNDVSAHS